MNVNCPGCQHSYKLDEKRIPESGQRMRCPKCSTSFRVLKSGETTGMESKEATPSVPPRPSVMPKRPSKPNRPSSIPKPKAEQSYNSSVPLVLGGSDADLAAPTTDSGRISESDFGEIDLPGPVDSMDLPAPKTSDPFGDIDLPTPAVGADLPAPKKPADDPFGDIDLPTPAIGADLPAPKKPADDPFGEIDLPTPALGADLPAPKKSTDDPFSEIDLPTPAVGADLPAPKKPADDPFGEIDLPTPAVGADLPAPSGVDLPTPAQVSDLPTPSVGADLPTPIGAVDLPSPAVGADLPSPIGSVDLPAVGEQVTDLPEPQKGVTDLPSPSQAMEDLPEPAGGVTGLPRPLEGEAPPPGNEGIDHAARVSSSGSTDFGEIDLGGLSQAPQGDDAGEFDAFPTSSEEEEEDPRRDSLPLADIPHEEKAPGGIIDDAPPEESPTATGKTGSKKFEGRRKYERQSRKTRVAILAVLGLLIAVGGGLYFTPFGPFGVNYITKLLPNAAEGKVIEQLEKKVAKRSADDTYPALMEAVKEIKTTRKEFPDSEELQLLGVITYNWIQIRFGADNKIHRAGTKLLGKINVDESESPYAKRAKASLDLLALKVPNVVGAFKGQKTLDQQDMAILAEAHLFESDFVAAGKIGKRMLSKKWTPRGAYLMARALVGQQNQEDAVKALEKLVQTSGTHVDGKLLLAQLLREEKGGDQERVQALLNEVIALPEMTTTSQQKARAHALLASNHLLDKDYAQANGQLELAKNSNPKDVVFLTVTGMVALISDDLTAAFSAFSSATTEDPSAIDAHLGMAETMIKQGKLSDAKELLESKLPVIPNDPRAHYLMGLVESSLKNDESAQRAFGKAIALDTTYVEPYIGLFKLLMRLKRDTEAMRTLDEASEASPTSSLVKMTLADGHSTRGDFAAAIVSLNEALEIDPNNIKAHFRMAQMYRKMESVEDARQALAEVASRAPSHPGLALEQGLLLEMTGNVDKALAAYEKALAANPDDLGAKIRVAVGSLFLKKIDRAKDLLGQVLEIEPKNAEANFYMGEAYRQAEVPTEAVIYLKAAKELNEANPLYHLRYGMALMMMRDMPSAMKEFTIAKDLDPKMAETYLRIGEAKLRSGSARDAIKVLDHALSLNPKLSEAYGLIGEAFEELADLRSSMAYYQKAIREIPDDGKMHFKLALTLLQVGNERGAMSSFEKAVSFAAEEDPLPQWLPEALYRLGVGQMSAGKTAAAIATFEAYLQHAPEKALDRSEVAAHLSRLKSR